MLCSSHALQSTSSYIYPETEAEANLTARLSASVSCSESTMPVLVVSFCRGLGFFGWFFWGFFFWLLGSRMNLRCWYSSMNLLLLRETASLTQSQVLQSCHSWSDEIICGEDLPALKLLPSVLWPGATC